MPKRQYPSVDYLRQCFRYEDGKLYWLVRPREHFKSTGGWKMWNTKFPGKEAGSLRSHKKGPRWALAINNVLLARSILVYIIHRGTPTGFVDHINRNPVDDRIENLREATGSQNNANSRMPKTNTSGFKGVTWHKESKKWVGQIKKDGKMHYLGLFADPKKAHEAYCSAAKTLFGEFARTE